jgi:SAM-dependent methyltransferase
VSDLTHELMSEPNHRRRRPKNDAIARRDRFINEQLTGLAKEDLVLNVGCGMVRRFEIDTPARFLATDLRALSNVDFAADATALPLADDSVDAVISLELLEHVPDPKAVLAELARVLRPGGVVVISAPSGAVPRHDDHDFWRFTAEGLERLCSEFFPDGKVEVFGGTFEALGYLGFYYLSLVLHRIGMKGRALADAFPAAGHWLDERNSWSTSTSALHTLAFDLLFVGSAS